jgi:hypothetical protein
LSALRLAVLSIVLLALAGCFRTTIRSGRPTGESPPGWRERWHAGWLAGAVEASGPHDLSAICPGGWAEIDSETDPSQALITLSTLGIYAPQTVTVVCAAESDEPPLAPPLPD